MNQYTKPELHIVQTIDDGTRVELSQETRRSETHIVATLAELTAYKAGADAAHHLRAEEAGTRHLKSEDAKHLRWIQERLVKVHLENPNTDYMQRLGFIISGVELSTRQSP